MAIAVRGYYESGSGWYSTSTSNPATGVSWESGDVIVVAGWISDVGDDFVDPTNANLTFTVRQEPSPAAGQTRVGIWTAKAGSTQSSQTIAFGADNSGNVQGCGVWVFSGADDYSTGTSSVTNPASALSLATDADSVVVYIFGDWNAAGSTPRTATTGSGTETTREDSIDGSWGGVFAAEWLGTSATTTTYGVTSYTSMIVTHAAVQITASAAAQPITPSGASVSATAGSVTVTGATVPSAVSDLAGTAGNAQVVLTWSAPSNGGSAITDYIVEYREA